MTIRNYGAIASIEELAEFTERVISAGTSIAIDIETGFLGEDKEKGAIHRATAILVGISFTNSMDWARYVPLAHDRGENLDNYRVAQLFWDVVQTGLTVAHNFSFELRHLSKWFLEQLADDPLRGAAVRASNGYFPIKSDTLVEAYLAAEFQWFGLKYLTKVMFGHVQTELHELFGEDFKVKNRKFIRFNTLELTPQVINYACEDSVWCLGIHQRYYDKIKDRLLFGVEKAIVTDVLPFMEDEGILYDWTLMRRTAEKLRDFRDRFNAEIMADLSELAGEPIAINLASPLQVRKTLYEKLGMRTTVFTDKTRDLEPDKRVMSTGDLALRKLVDKFPVTKKVLQWREQTKLLGTYLDKYEKAYNIAGDGHAHPSHLSAFVITGRFAHSDPNYAQSPKKYHFDLYEAKAAHAAGEEPPPGTCFTFNFRDVIMAPKGWYILGFDLSQAELRAIAGEAQEHALLEAFENNEDVHRVTASLMLGIPIDEVTDDHRGVGKAQPVDEPVLTPFGWRRIGELVVGDEVIARDGSATKVTGVYPQGKRQIYEIKTLDGGCVRASDEHWWLVEPIAYDSRLMTTEQLAKVDLKQGARQYKFHLPAIQPPQLHGSSLELDPYLLGLLIGDGSMTTETPFYCSADPELIEAAAAALPHECELKLVKEKANLKCPSYRIVHRDGKKNMVAFFMRHFGLAGKKAHFKFIPPRYLMADPSSRLALLQGLLDTDGSVAGSHGFEFSSASLQLAQDVQQLVWSLGGRARIGPTTAKTAWRLWGRLPHGVAPFRLQRKLAKMSRVPSKQAVKRPIVSVEPVGVEECVCISVEHPERLYITKDYIPTHNTLNFALLYGMSVKGLADRLAIPIEEAQSLMDKYFAGMSAIAAYMEKQIRLGKEQGYVESCFGRTLPIWEYQSDNPYIRSKGDRACVNYPIQGAATGDYMKIAMVRVVHAIKKAGLADKIKLVMNVHDALEFYVHASLNPEDVIRVLKPAVVFDVDGWPTMKADWHLARRWGSPTDIDVHDDGTITAKGTSTVEDLVPSIEVDEEGNEIYAMPEVDEQVLHEAVGTPLGRHVVVTLKEMPPALVWMDFREFLTSLPGRNVTRLITPEGEMDLMTPSGLTPAHLGVLNQFFPGCTVTYLQEYFEGLAEGLNL